MRIEEAFLSATVETEKRRSAKMDLYRRAVKTLKDCRGEEEAEMCAICLNELAAPRRVKQLQCGHRFHSTCLLRWLVRCAFIAGCLTLALTLKETLKEILKEI